MKAGVLNMAFCIHKGIGLVCMHAWGLGPGARCAVYSYILINGKGFSLTRLFFISFWMSGECEHDD